MAITIMASSNRNVFRVTGPLICEWNPPVTDGAPSQRPVTRSFDVSFDLRLNKRLSKLSRRRWIETPSRFSDVTVMVHVTEIYQTLHSINGNKKADFPGSICKLMRQLIYLTQHHSQFGNTGKSSSLGYDDTKKRWCQGKNKYTISVIQIRVIITQLTQSKRDTQYN